MDRAAQQDQTQQDQMQRDRETFDQMSDDRQPQMKQDDQQRAGGGMKQAFDHLKEAAKDAREAMQQQRNQ